MIDDTRPFRYLNVDSAWPCFHWQHLVLGPDGALRLPGLPALEGMLPSAISSAPSAPAPAGVVADSDGTVYFSEPARNMIWRVEGCFSTLEATPCIGSSFKEPAGLAIASRRHALYVADAGNASVKIFDLESLALAEVLDGFVRPVSLAIDSDGNLYVADVGTNRVEMITATGDLVAAFGDMVHASSKNPCAVALENELVYVLDAQTQAVSVFSERRLEQVIETDMTGARVFTVIDAVLYVADPGRHRIVVWQRDQSGTYRNVGDAIGYEGPAAAMAAAPFAEGAPGLLVSPGAGLAPINLRVNASHAEQGWLWSESLIVGERSHMWNRMTAAIELPPGSHVEFFVHTGPRDAPPPEPREGGQFDAPWRAVGGDITSFYIDLHGEPSEALWLGARFVNDQASTPALSQARLDFDQTSYMEALPAIYRPAPEGGNFLQRFLSLFESFYDELEDKLDGLPALLDPAAAPTDSLPWLAGWLALPLSEVRSEAAQRAAIAGAWANYARRGTATGLRDVLLAEAGVRAVIDEPLQTTSWWRLPAMATACSGGGWTDGEDSILGFNTGLAQAEEQGAVLGSTATMDHAHLITAEEFGAPLFEGAAWRFVVRLYPGQLECAGKIEQVRAIIEREKPAHTLYEMCVIDSALRVGYQSTLGVDTVLGGAAPAPVRLGEGALVLGGEPRGRLGVSSRVGTGVQL